MLCCAVLFGAAVAGESGGCAGSGPGGGPGDWDGGGPGSWDGGRSGGGGCAPGHNPHVVADKVGRRHHQRRSGKSGLGDQAERVGGRVRLRALDYSIDFRQYQ